MSLEHTPTSLVPPGQTPAAQTSCAPAFQTRANWPRCGLRGAAAGCPRWSSALQGGRTTRSPRGVPPVVVLVVVVV
eukprot:1142665-Pelagomonas_calceolata.AAC.10